MKEDKANCKTGGCVLQAYHRSAVRLLVGSIGVGTIIQSVLQLKQCNILISIWVAHYSHTSQELKHQNR